MNIGLVDLELESAPWPGCAWLGSAQNGVAR